MTETRLCFPRYLTHVFSLTLLLGLAPVDAWAAGPWHEELARPAREHFDLGMRYSSEQRYDRAIAEFREAYARDPHPKILYTLGQVYRLANDCMRAIAAYTEFLQSNPASDLAQLTRDNMARCEATLQHSPPPSAAAGPSAFDSSAGAPDGALVVPPPTALSPASPIPLSTSTPPAITPWYFDIMGNSLLAAGVVGVSASVAFYVSALDHRSAMQRATKYSDYQGELRSGKAAQRLATYALAGGVALAAGAVLRYLTRAPSSSTPVGYSQGDFSASIVGNQGRLDFVSWR